MVFVMETPQMTRKANFIQRAKSRLVRCHKKMFSKKSSFRREIPTLNGNVLETIMEKLNLKERVRMRMVSRGFCTMVDCLPVHLPFLMVHTNQYGQFELISDEIDFVAGYLLCGMEEKFKNMGDYLAMNEKTTVECVKSIISQVSSIDHLWLDSSCNGKFAREIVEYFAEDANSSRRRRFSMNQLTVIGSSENDDFEWFTKLTLLCRRSLSSLRFRHIRLCSEEQSRSFWTSVGQCHKLTKLQYEPCKMDNWSRVEIINALENKALKTLILTGVDGLSPLDISRISQNGTLSEMSVVCDSLRPSTLSINQLKGTIRKLNNMLIQVDSWFSVHDMTERLSLLSILNTLSDQSILEIVHVIKGNTHEITKAVSYWMELACETGRTIKLKLDDVSQEKLDSSVGKMLRKCREIERGEWNSSGIWLQMEKGKLLILDRKTWFGDDEMIN